MPTATRTFRVFVSSTFEDLQAERDVLQRDVFSKLRKLCEENGARFQAIDLRWGVRDEAALDQQTIEICLREIERCQQTGIKPNFIVLLGDRYGWRPLPASIKAEDFERVRGAISVGEALGLVDDWYHRDDNALPPEYLLKPRTGEFVEAERWSQIEQRLLQVLRTAAHTAGLAPADLIKYEASATHQEIIRGLGKSVEDRLHVFAFFRGGIESGDRDVRELKRNLKAQLGDNVFSFNAGDYDGLCQRVKESIEKVVISEAQRFESRPALDPEVEAHDAFAKDRSRHFVGRKSILDAINEYLNSDDRRTLVIQGESGSGKSAILAQASGAAGVNGAVRRFIGATPESSSGITLLRSLCLEIARRYGQPEEAPATFNKLTAAFADRLKLATRELPLILFIDALDQLGTDDPATPMRWLPGELPPNCKVIVSTIEVTAALKGAQLQKVEAFPLEDANEALRLWLEKANRTLQPGQRGKLLVSFRRTPLPLYLKLAFEESRRWRSFEPPEKCVLGEGLAGIVDQLFARLSEESNHGRVLVGHALGYLTAARYGLTEDEILDVLAANDDVWSDFERTKKHGLPKYTVSGTGSEKRQIPVVVWSRLYFDLEPYLTERTSHGETTISFYHRQLSQQVSTNPLDHWDLAEYFEPRWRESSVRALTELVYQRVHAKDLRGLERILTDLEFVEGKCSRGLTDDLLTDYGGALSLLKNGAQVSVGDFARFVRDNAQQLRAHPRECLQLAMLEPARSEVGMLARRLSDRLAKPCLEPVSPITTGSQHSLRFTGHKGRVVALAFRDDHNELISSDGSEVIRWDVASAAPIARFSLPQEEGVVGSSVAGERRLKVSLAADATCIAIGGLMIDAITARELCRVPRKGVWTAPPAVSPDSSQLAVCTRTDERGRNARDHAVRVFACLSSKLVAELTHPGTVKQCLFSPDSRQLVTLQMWAGYDQAATRIDEGKSMLRVWDLKTLRTVHKIQGDFDNASYSPDGSLLMATTGHNYYGWSTSDWSQVFYVWDSSETPYGLTVLDKSKVITWGINSVTLRNIQSCQAEGRLTFSDERNWIYTLALAPDRSAFALGCGDGRIELWSLESLHQSRPTDVLNTDVRHLLSQGRTIAFSPNGRHIVFGRGDHTVTILDARSGSTITSRSMFDSGQVEEVERCCFDKDGHSLLVLSRSSRVSKEITHFGSLRRLSAIDLLDQAVFECKSQEFLGELRFSPDGERVFVSCKGSLLQLKADNLVLRRELKSENHVIGWTLSPDGSEVVWTNKAGIWIWNLASGEVVRTNLGFYAGQPVFAPDGILLAVSVVTHHPQILTLICLPEGREIAYIRQNVSVGWNAWLGPDRWDFSPDGRRILLASSKGLAISDVRDGRSCVLDQGGFELQDPNDLARYGRIQPYQFSPDGQFVFGVDINCIRIWHCESGTLVAALPLASIHCSSIDTSGSCLALNQAGAVLLFRFRNLPQGLPIVTATHVYESDTHTWSSSPTALCPRCGSRFVVPAAVIGVILDFVRTANLCPCDSPILRLPSEAWSAEGLVNSCPSCGTAVRFNPFICGRTQFADSPR